MPAPDPLADIDQLLAAAASTAPMGGFATPPSTSSASSYVTPQMGAWQVYMGQRPGDPLPAREDGEGGHFARMNPRDADDIAYTDQAAGQIYGWDDKKIEKWAEHLVSNGLLKPGEFNFSDLVQMWQGAVEEAGNLYTLGGKKVTPWDFIETYAGANGLAGKSGSGGPTTRTSTSTSVQEFDDLDARAAAEDTYAELMGRRASGKEAAALKRALNAYAQAHPQVRTETSVDDGEGNVTSNSKTSGGISAAGAQQIAVDQARAEPDYAEYQAATTMFSWLQQAMGSTADV